MQGSSFWGAAHVYPNSERIALENLKRQDYNCFCPFFLSRITGTKNFRSQPLFAGYVFIEIEEDRPWGPINSTNGIIRLLATKVGDMLIAQRVPLDFVNSLKRIIVRNPDIDRQVIEEGACVRVLKGSLRDHKAIVTWSKDERLKLLFSLLGREVEVEMGIMDVEEV